MMPAPNDELSLLRAEIAAAAARLIAQDGADYGSAKRKAARQVLGERRAGADALPDNAQIETELKRYQALFAADTQPARLRALRGVAVEVMELLAPYQPYLTGSVLSGSAGEHDDIYLDLFADSAKEVEIFLLNRRLQIEISATPHFKGPRHAAVEMVSFLWRKEGVHLALYEAHDLRGARKTRADGTMARADLDAVRALLAEESATIKDQA